MQGKIALITGATSGIGAGFARRFAADGYDLIITGRRRGEQVPCRRVERTCGVRSRSCCASFEQDDLESLAEGSAEPGVEVLVNNAGFGTTEFFHRRVSGHENMLAVHRPAPTEQRRNTQAREGTIINVSRCARSGPEGGSRPLRHQVVPQ